MLESLLSVITDLTDEMPIQQRYQRLLTAIRRVIPCDACALLRFDNACLYPLAIDGLSQDTLGRRFRIFEHPRLQQIVQSPQMVRFDSNCALPDPYDGLVLNDSHGLQVHDCMGISLRLKDQLIGVLTLDAADPGSFDNLDATTIQTIAALTAAVMQTTLHIERLQQHAQQQSHFAQQLVSEVLNKEAVLIGQSPVMRQLNDEMNVVSQSDLSVLITGETGVGKELVAQQIHRQSQRARKPLVYINCAALPESIAESELFGHCKGAFTGAVQARGGKFELADGGTLFLDEVGELPLTIQAKLLRALQSGEIQRVGSDQVQQVNVRILAATNRDLKAEVEAGQFRADLFHRLSVFPVAVPPLRQRDGDIPLLIGYFMEQMRVKLGLRNLIMDKGTMQLFEQYDWPGNVRELEHVISRAALRARADQMGKSIVSIEGLYCDIQADAQPFAKTGSEEMGLDLARLDQAASMQQAVDQFKLELLKQRLHQFDDNWSEAARSLAVDRGNLHRLAKRLGLK